MQSVEGGSRVPKAVLRRLHSEHFLEAPLEVAQVAVPGFGGDSRYGPVGLDEKLSGLGHSEHD
jgi:hypothetical protein